MSYTTSKKPLFALVDCNNFFVSCERVFNPKVLDKPVVVLSNNDGCVVARSNEAKALGIKMGEPFFKIKDLCQRKHIHYFSSNYSLYGDMSSRVMRLLEKACPDIQIYSIDEAFIRLDNMPIDPISFCLELRQTILQSTGLPVSFGIGATKTLAKVSADIAKKSTNNGVYSILNSDTKDPILGQFPIKNVWGVGKKTAEKLSNMQVHTVKEFVDLPTFLIRKFFTINGERMQKELLGISCFDLEDCEVRKHITSSRSFGKPVTDLFELQEAISNHVAHAAEKLRNQKSRANALLVFLRTNHFQKKDKQYANHATVQFLHPTSDTMQMITTARNAITKLYKPGYNYKKCGITLIDLVSDSLLQQDLFSAIDYQKNDNQMKLIDTLNAKLGKNKLFYAAQGVSRTWQMKSDHKSPCYTTMWSDILLIN